MIPTLRIDKLAGQGMRFTNFNVQSHCTQTRSVQVNPIDAYSCEKSDDCLLYPLDVATMKK